MMSDVYSILYFGIDDDFFKSLSNFVTKHENSFQIEMLPFEDGTIVKQSTEGHPAIVFIDLTSLDINLDTVLREIIFIKHHPALRPTLFVGLISEEAQRDAFSNVFTSGIQYVFVKGCDEDLFFRDCFYIRLGKEVFPVEFALAKGIYKDSEIGITSSLSKISSTEFVIEGDHVSLICEAKFNLNMFPDLKRDTFNIELSSEMSLYYPMSVSHVFKFPIAGPWDEQDETTLMKETIDTWFEFNREKLRPTRKTIHVLTNDVGSIYTLFQRKDEIPYHIHCSDNHFSDEFIQKFKVHLPEMIFLDIKNSEDGENDFQSVGDLMDICKHLQFYPVFVLGNCASTSTALQKLFNYTYLVATNKPMSFEIIQGLSTVNFKKRSAGQEVNESFHLSESNPHRNVDLLCVVKISSITEHEFTFVTDFELPMFSVVHFFVPIDVYGTIVPAYKKLSQVQGKFHYMALINGASEDKLKILRQFINYVIQNPLESFEHSEVMALITKMNERSKPQPVAQPEKLPEAEIEESITPELKPLFGHIIKGRSKL